MHRRQFLQRTTRAALAVPFAMPLLASGPDALRHACAQPRILDLLRDPSAVQALGTAYRTAHPAEDDVRLLTTRLLAAPGSGPPAARLDRQVRQEFAEGHTVMLNGWILARTEARQCALYSLLYA